MTAPLVDTGVPARQEIERRPLSAYLLGDTWTECLATLADRYEETIAYRWLKSPDAAPVDISFRALQEGAAVAAASFAALDERPVVASLLPAVPATLPLAFGAMWAGVYMPINGMLGAEAVASMLTEAGAQVVLVPADAPQWEHLAGAVPGLRVVPVGASPLKPADIAALGTGPVPPLPAADDICAYFHTGGTTGRPKVAMLRHKNLAFMAWLAGFGGGMEKGDVVPNGMPLFHVGGLVFGGLAPLVAGARVVQLGAAGYRDAAFRAAFPKVANREGATILFAPPTIAIDVLNTHPKRPFETARHWVSSAAPLPVATHEAFTAHTGLSVKEAWGLTEATLVLTFAPVGADSRPGSVGPALPFCQLAAVDQNTMRPRAHGEIGLIIARSPGLFAGYLGGEEAGFVTGPDGETWLDTGDLGMLDEDGWLTITGRAKDMILRGGHNIDPATIEEAYLAQPDVVAAIAVGKPDTRVGERPVVFVTARQAIQLDVDALRSSASEAIADPVARPSEVHVLASLPITAVGKPDRPALRRAAARAAVAEVVLDAQEIETEAGPGGTILVQLVPASPRDCAAVRALGLSVKDPVNEAELS